MLKQREQGPAQETPEGRWAVVSAAITPSGVGEVSVRIRGGIEYFYARSEEEIKEGEEVVVTEYHPPRTVIVNKVER